MSITDMTHSLGPTCAYHEEPTDASDDSETPPKVKAQFFYISALPIDDPLSPLPPVQSESKILNQPPTPFSPRDNAALEEAWQGLQRDRERDRRGKGGKTGELFRFPRFRRRERTQDGNGFEGSHNNLRSPVSESLPDVIQTGGKTVVRQPVTQLVPLQLASQSLKEQSKSRHQQEIHGEGEVTLEQHLVQHDVFSSDLREITLKSEKSTRRRRISPLRNLGGDARKIRTPSPRPIWETSPDISDGEPATNRKKETDISGRPFARFPSHRPKPTAHDGADSESDKSPTGSRFPDTLQSHNRVGKVLVPVGVSRLHLVEFPDMLMKPIYWHPVNDISTVTRGTWFYLQTMRPVEPEVANQLEIGYEEMRPWTRVWQEELDVVVQNGADAELKVMHRLWPDEPSSEVTHESSTTNPTEALLPSHAENRALGAEKPAKPSARKLYHNYSAVYLNAKDAQLLKLSLIPSESRGRKPLSSIRKGRQIGIAVVRGFDRNAWEKIYAPQKMTSRTAQAKIGAYMSQSGDAATSGRRASCVSCREEETLPRVTDLILVIHGIGQKLSERVDSFHFTHAINSLRREINVELADQASREILQEDTLGGVMVLPINWRANVTFDDTANSSPKKENDSEFQLKDITPLSLPAVRNLISDVMLDIPYYLSHHKDKMTSAVVREANRVYRLWCRNNPEFQEHGRVHLMAHSLGSVMAIDILSNQPTRVTPINLKSKKNLESQIFEFNTSTLFSCGSPAGFFLLLNKANLLPRKGLNKPGFEGEDEGRGIAGEAGVYGCLAVNNLFNIVHRNDPIAYLQNACVDADYARSLVPAIIPSATPSVLRRIGSVMWPGSGGSHSHAFLPGYSTPTMNQVGMQAASASSTESPNLPRSAMSHLPSAVELETHNFSREEVAEKRMYLLNDNGQIDFFLNPQGGIQYLDMLGAHSSYWYSRDLVRFLVVEVRRDKEKGRGGALGGLRAVKKRAFARNK